MPQVIPLIVWAAAEIGGLTALEVGLLTVVSSLAVGFYEQAQARAQAAAASKAALQDRLITLSSGVGVRGYVLGTVRTGGTIQYMQTTGSKQEALDAVIAFANNECEIVDWWIGDDQIEAGGFPGSKYGRVHGGPISETFNVTGPTATVTLSETVFTGIPHATWRSGGSAGIGTVTVVNEPAGQYQVSGMPSAACVVTMSYNAEQAASLRGEFKPGNLSQTVTDWDGYTTSNWDSSHQLLGVCYVRTLMIWDQNVYQNGAPSVGATLTGHAVTGYPFFDPRDNSNPVKTSNPAILAGWWMTLPRNLGGCGIPSDWIDWSSIAAAANVCDEIVSISNGQGGYIQIARYSCNTVLGTDSAPLDNLDIILSSMAGRRAFTAGVYRIFAGAFRPATITLTDADIAADAAGTAKQISVSTGAPSEDPPNIVTATFADSTQNYQESSPKPVRNDAYVAEDGHEEPLDLQLKATTVPQQARYLMGIALEQARPAFTVHLSVGGVGETLALGDTVQLDLVNRAAYAGRTFEVTTITDNWDGTFDLVLSEIKSTTFALDPNSFTPVAQVAPPDNSYLWNPPAPSGLTVAAVTPQTLPDGTVVSRVDIEWDPIPGPGNVPGAYIELRYQVAGGHWIDAGQVPGDQTATTITTALEDGEVYQFEARFVNGIGATSDWVDAWSQISGTPLPSPLSLRLQASSPIFRVPTTGNALPLSIDLTAVRGGGLTAPVTWQTNPTVTLGGSGDDRTLAFSDLGTNDSVQITITATQARVTYQDTTTIAKVLDGQSYTPDLTAPPTPTGLNVTAGLTHFIITWTDANYTQGHGNAGTIVYAAQRTGSNPTFGNATPVGSSASSSFVMPVGTGETWAFWIKFQSRDGALSQLPAGGTNGVQATTGLIGGANLADDLVTAAKLADGSVTATKLAQAAVDSTKLASGLQAVLVVTGALPSTNVGAVIYHTDDSKLYHWNGTTYTAATAAADISGQLTDSQLAAISAAKLTGSITSTQIADGAISTPKLAAGSVTSSQIAADTITAGNIAAGAIGVSELAANSVTSSAIAANSITAGKIAAAAVNSAQIAAGAITTDKLLVTGKGAALNHDPSCSDASAWTLFAGSPFTIATITDGQVGNTVIRSASGLMSWVNSHQVPFDPTKTYRVRGTVRNVGGNGPFFLVVALFDANGTNINGDGTQWYYPFEGSVPSSFTAYSAMFGASVVPTFPAGAKTMAVGAILNYLGTTGYMEAQDLRIEEAIGSSLIVDGGITATKLAANSIAVGTAAIQNGAIVNAMIGDATIDSAKILELQVSKLSSGTLDAAIQVGNGEITWDNGAFMKVIGVGFGTSGQFLEWFGPHKTGINQCQETDAIAYLKTDGTAYFGGALLAGKLYASAQGVVLDSTNVCSVGPYSSNGGIITITASLGFRSELDFPGTTAGLQAFNAQVMQSPNFTMILSCSVGGGAFTDVATFSVSGSFTSRAPIPTDGEPGNYKQSGFGSLTYTDSLGSTATRQYKLRFSVWNNVNAPVQSNILGITSLE